MTLPAERARSLLREAHELDRAHDYPALAGLLDPHPAEELLVEPELTFLKADVLRRVGRGEEALTALDVLEPVLARRGNDRLHRRRLNLLGSLHFESGRVEDAKETWLEQLDDAGRDGDEEFAGRANNNLGVVATLRGRLAEALGHYGRAVASYQRLGYTRGLAQSHHNLGITYREIGFPTDSDTHFRRAARLAREDGSEDELARVEQERALLLYLLGDVRMARATAARALARYRELGDPAGEGEVQRVLALAALGEGRLDEAAQAVERALERAEAARAVLLEAEVREVRAALLRRRGREGAAEEEEARAGALFEQLGAPGWGRRIRDRYRGIAARAAYPGPGASA